MTGMLHASVGIVHASGCMLLCKEVPWCSRTPFLLGALTRLTRCDRRDRLMAMIACNAAAMTQMAYRLAGRCYGAGGQRRCVH